MDLFLLVSSILFGTFGSVACPPEYKDARVLGAQAGQYVVVAMLPSDACGHDDRVNALIKAADTFAAHTGKEVILTDDLLAYLSLKRIAVHGVSDYERRVLASRLSQAKDRIRYAEPHAP